MQLGSFGWLEGLVGAVIAIGGGIMAWRKSRSADAVDVVKDQAEIGTIELITRERDRAYAERDRLTAKVEELQTRDAQRLERINDLEREVDISEGRLRRALRRLPQDERDSVMSSLAPLDEGPRS